MKIIRILKIFYLFIYFLLLTNMQSSLVAQENNIVALLKSFQFDYVHHILLKRIESGDIEAHFDLARTLLIELAWSDAVNKKGLSFRIKKKIGSNPIYSAFDKNQNGQIILQVNSIGSILISDVIMQVWWFKDYPRFVVEELDKYLSSKEIKNRSIADKWKSILISSINSGKAMPVPELSKQKGLTDQESYCIAAVSKIMVHLSIGDIQVDQLPIE